VSSFHSANELRDNAGAAAKGGFSYQDLIAAYLLICRGLREIWLERDGEDILTLDPIPDQPSRHYYQCKYRKAGATSSSQLLDLAVASLDRLYQVAENKNRFLKYTFVSNIPPSSDCKQMLDKFKAIRKHQMTWEQFESRFLRRGWPRKIRKVAKNTKTEEDLARIACGIHYDWKRETEIRYEIIEHLKNYGVTKPRESMLMILGFLTEKKQEQLTRSMLEQLLHINFERVTSSAANTYQYAKADIDAASEFIRTEIPTLSSTFLDAETERKKIIRLRASHRILATHKLSKKIDDPSSGLSKMEKEIMQEILAEEISEIPSKIKAAENSGREYLNAVEEVKKSLIIVSENLETDDEKGENECA
jgi:hypothetical protein